MDAPIRSCSPDGTCLRQWVPVAATPGRSVMLPCAELGCPRGTEDAVLVRTEPGPAPHDRDGKPTGERPRTVVSRFIRGVAEGGTTRQRMVWKNGP